MENARGTRLTISGDGQDPPRVGWAEDQPQEVRAVWESLSRRQKVFCHLRANLALQGLSDGNGHAIAGSGDHL